MWDSFRTKRLLRILLITTLILGYWGYKKIFSCQEVTFKEVIVSKDGKGKKINLASLQGKVTLVAFFQTWCGDCIREMPTILNLQSQVQNPDFKVLMVSDEKDFKLEAFKKRFPEFRFDYYLSDKSLPEFGIEKYPTTYLVDEDGSVLKSSLEGFDWSQNSIIEIVNAHLK